MQPANTTFRCFAMPAWKWSTPTMAASRMPAVRSSRWARVGLALSAPLATEDGGDEEAVPVVWGIQPSTGQILKIDPRTGAIIWQFSGTRCAESQSPDQRLDHCRRGQHVAVCQWRHKWQQPVSLGPGRWHGPVHRVSSDRDHAGFPRRLEFRVGYHRFDFRD